MASPIYSRRMIVFGRAVFCVSLVLAGPGTLPAEDIPWARKADMPTARNSFAIAVVDGRIYAIGGRMATTDGFSDVEEYDPATDTWTRKADMPTGRKGPVAAVVDGKIYVIGGDAGSTGEGFSVVEIYDPVADAWTAGTEMLHPRSFMTAAAVDGKIYVMGGWSDGATAFVEEYDPATDDWTDKNPVPVSLSHHPSAVVGGKIYVAGSMGAPSGLFVYDPVTDTWEREEDHPAGGMDAFAMDVADGTLYVLGGLPVNGSQALDTVSRYAPVAGIWTRQSPMPTARASLGVAVVEETIYAIGGATGIPWQAPGEVLGTVEAYTPLADPSSGTIAEEESFPGTEPGGGPSSGVMPEDAFFIPVSEQAIRTDLDVGRSVAFGDYDNDGWPDILMTENFSSAESRIRLLHNEGDGTFGERTAVLQGNLAQGRRKGGGALFGDYDNDGDLDLFVPIGDFGESGANLLLRNDWGVFREVSAEAGLTDDFPTDNAIWLDFDRDGHLDLYTGNLSSGNPALRNKLYRNNGDGTFTDVTEGVGLSVPIQRDLGGSNGGMAAGDFNDDGWPDLYIGAWQDRNRLFLNDGQGSFQDITTGDIGDPGEAYGVAVGDIDNDGDLDIFQAAGGSGQAYRSLMLLNLGDAQFLDVTEGVGLVGLEAAPALGVSLADIDNDGDLDLLTATPHFLYLNNGDGTFADGTDRSGIADVANAVSFGDYDLDGFLDVLFVSGPAPYDRFGELYRNRGGVHHWLRVELVGTESNRSGIGTRLTATAGDLQQMREVLGGLGYYQDELVVHFGLGSRTQVDELEIRWPSGKVDVLTDIPADQKIRVFEGRREYHVVRPTLWEHSLPDTVVIGATIAFAAQVRPAFFESRTTINRVTMDLGDFGGPEDVLLGDQGDGIYFLETIVPVDADGILGTRAISVMIEQTTSLGPHWVQLTKSIEVVPTMDDAVILDGVVADLWKVETRGSVEGPEFADAGIDHAGEMSGAFRVGSDGWSVKFVPELRIDTLMYKGLRFAFHPGNTAGSVDGTLALVVNSSWAVDLVKRDGESVGVDLARPAWQVVELPLTLFEPGRYIRSIRFAGSLGGTFYLDDLRLTVSQPSPAATAIREEHTVTQPQSLALCQNYPNPFNSSTTIRFSLPQQEMVALTIYNLAGQEVATLASSLREAGTYTLRWDGRDGEGRELASGVYLYRLQAGEQVETRKLLLLR